MFRNVLKQLFRENLFMVSLRRSKMSSQIQTPETMTGCLKGFFHGKSF